MTRAEKAYKKILDITEESNPTFALAGITIENIVGKQARIEMMLAGLIKHVGKYNGHHTYQIRI